MYTSQCVTCWDLYNLLHFLILSRPFQESVQLGMQQAQVVI